MITYEHGMGLPEAPPESLLVFKQDKTDKQARREPSKKEETLMITYDNTTRHVEF
jgi:hypothetical protein